MKRKADGQLNLALLGSSQAEPFPAQKPSEVPAQSTQLIVKRDGTTETFNVAQIALAIESAFKAVRNIPADEPMNGAMVETINSLSEKVAKRLFQENKDGAAFEVERIQDAIESQLMVDGFLTEARRFILYREDRRKIREQKAQTIQPAPPAEPAYIIHADGRQVEFDVEHVRRRITEAAHGLDGLNIEALVQEIKGFVSNGTTTTQIEQIIIATAKGHQAENPAYDKLAARLFLKDLYAEAIPEICPDAEFAALHQLRFSHSIQDAVHADHLAPELLMYDLEFLSTAVKLERDELIGCDGLEWLYEMCLARDGERRVETPQYFWMRIAMALSANEGDAKEQRAVEFYEILSSLRFVPSEKLLRTSGRAVGLSSRISAEADEVEITTRAAGHVNVAAVLRSGTIDELQLFETVTSAVRLLDNAIDLSRYRLDATEQHAREHREIALGIVGLGAPGEVAERCSELVAYYATLASANLAAERGACPSHSDSNWFIGALPFESLNLMQAGSSGSPQVNCAKDWLFVRGIIRQNGIRNGHLLALTPAHIVEKLIRCGIAPESFANQLDQIVRCRKWVDGPVYITLPSYLAGPDLEQACLLAQQLGIRAYMPPTKLTISDTHPFIDAAAATKVLKSIEKS